MMTLHKLSAAASTAWAVALAPAAQAQSTIDGVKSAQATVTTVAASDMTDGEVRKVDVEGGKLTLKHGEIKNLDMPSMTMVFVAKDRALLETLKAGDKVKFEAINDGSKFTVTDVQPVR